MLLLLLLLLLLSRTPDNPCKDLKLL